MTNIEKRMRKYPETDTFHYYNANSKNKITGDCVIRAISRATDIPYNDVVMGLAELHCKTGFNMESTECYDRFLKEHGWKKYKQPRQPDNTKYTGKEFCKELFDWFNGDVPRKIIAHIGSHHIVAIIDGKVNDIWNSTDGAIGNYWVKER